MTREERLELLKQIEIDIYVPSIESTLLDDAKSCAIHSAIEALEQEPKTGYWITKEAYSEDKAMGFTEQIVCSNCDMQNSYFSKWDECKNPISKTFIRSKFCPNCGCRMFEPQESEDKK